MEGGEVKKNVAQKPLGGRNGNGAWRSKKKLLKSFLAAVLLSALVERFFVYAYAGFLLQFSF